MIARKGIVVALLAAAAASLTGCQVLHELRPDQLWKLNHGIDGMKPDAYQSRYEGERSQPPVYFASISDRAVGE